MAMEKLGVKNEDLLSELTARYTALKEQEAEMIKEGSGDRRLILGQLQSLQDRIDELQKS